MGLDSIVVRGARQHNLKNITVEIPRRRLTVITGLSGSGKSSLAFDTIYAEGQRRYVESLSAYARQFLDQMERPDVDSIEGLSPAISIEQKTTSRSPRSTVGTITEVYDYLRLLYSSIGVPHCHRCGRLVARQSIRQILERIRELPPGERIMVLAPVVRGRKGEYRQFLEDLAGQGFVRARIDGRLRPLDEEIHLERHKNHTIEVVVDRLLIKPGIERRVESAIQTAMKLTRGIVLIAVVNGPERLYSERLACVDCGISIPAVEPRTFSFNSRYGACPSCSGLGTRLELDPAKIVPDPSRSLLNGGLAPWSNRLPASPRRFLKGIASHFRVDMSLPYQSLPSRVRTAVWNGVGGSTALEAGILQQLKEWGYHEEAHATRLRAFLTPRPCSACGGRRLRPESLAIKVARLSIADLTAFPLGNTLQVIRDLKLTPREETVAGRVVQEVIDRIEFLCAVGLEYLSLDRSASTLSGGEAQRIRLATQIGSRLRGVLYVLDEPSIGLHHRDNRRLLKMLQHLRDLGNTVLVVEHDEDTIRLADFVVDLGAGAGKAGGDLIAKGTAAEISHNPRSLTGRYISGELEIPVPGDRRKGDGKAVVVRGARQNNLKGINVRFPLGLFTVVSGVSGSGKSSLVNDILYRALARRLHGSLAEPGRHRSLSGATLIDKVIEIDQQPIGRSPHSNPATYTGLFTAIRELYASLPESRERGYKPGRFSFNVKGGRCEACQGDGLRRIEMSFLPDVYVQCDVCRGRRYNRETLTVRYKGRSIADLLESSVDEALEILANVPSIRMKLQTLSEVGLGYVHLGQSATTLSGGEAQRIKLARELSRRATGRTLYILDEPTTGLHFEDVKRLLEVLHRLTDRGNTVIVIEHQVDVIKTADWIIDLGPEGGEQGGRIVAQGTPEEVSRIPGSHTGQALAPLLLPAGLKAAEAPSAYLH
ncbi:MAG: excinuclease ABC subunit UvrA [Acidobacteriota bacterium]|nr:excinuclease ABC subunit UvrA [Acidobacteriota bacterium]MDE2963027.1 excinuclease ABC subunit UvrA [Acidobacteriota bacterium]